MTEFVEVKTADLVGAALDWAVAKAEGHQTMLLPIGRSDYRVCVIRSIEKNKADGFACQYSTDWNQGGPLIDKYHVQTSFNGCGFSRSPTGEHWCAYACDDSGAEIRPSGSGPTSLIAACRAIVASVLGETVSVPKELLS